MIATRILLVMWSIVAPSLMSVMVLCAQADESRPKTNNDTVVLLPSQVKLVDITCFVASGYGSGDEELVAINSKPDVVTYFGYNCDIPDSDYINYTLLVCSVMSSTEVKPKVKIAGDNLILSLTITKGNKRTFLHLLVPKMGPNGNVHLDIYTPPIPEQNK